MSAALESQLAFSRTLPAAPEKSQLKMSFAIVALAAIVGIGGLELAVLCLVGVEPVV